MISKLLCLMKGAEGEVVVVVEALYFLTVQAGEEVVVARGRHSVDVKVVGEEEVVEVEVVLPFPCARMG